MTVMFAASDVPPRSEVALRDRMPLLMRLPATVYGHIVAWLSEYIATTFFLGLALTGEQAAFTSASNASRLLPDVSQLLYASISQGFAFAVSCWAFFRITSGLFNPAITIGICIHGSLPWLRGAYIVVAQFLGAMTAAGIVDALLPGPMVQSVGLGSQTSTVRGFFIEFLLTAVFVFLVLMLAAAKHKGALLSSMALGIALFMVQLGGIMFTGCSLNPARAFAVSLAVHTFPAYHWIYWLGPVLGSILAVGMHRMNKQLEIETTDSKHRMLANDTRTVEEGKLNTQDSGGQAPAHRLSMVLEQDIEKGEAEHKPQ